MTCLDQVTNTAFNIFLSQSVLQRRTTRNNLSLTEVSNFLTKTPKVFHKGRHVYFHKETNNNKIITFAELTIERLPSHLHRQLEAAGTDNQLAD